MTSQQVKRSESTGIQAISNDSPQSEQDKALKEAEQCLQFLQQEDFLLDGFNLLGIVANPGGGLHQNNSHHHQHHPHQSPPSSPNGRQATPSNAVATPTSTVAVNGDTGTSANSGAPEETPPDAAPSYYTEYFSGTVQSLESTLGQVTEQIDTLNMFLEELSREYLGEYGDETTNLEYYLDQEEEEEEIDTTHIPPELASANAAVDSVRGYLQQSGELANSLKTTELRPSIHVLPNAAMKREEAANLKKAQADGDDGSDDKNGEKSSAESLEMVETLLRQLPLLIVQPTFDLTDATTFANLMVGDRIDESADTLPASEFAFAKRQMTPKESLLQPTSELIPASKPDPLTHHLDKVELALLEQVRQKSGAFFQETTRFRQLSMGVISLLDQTSQLRRVVLGILDSYKGVSDIPSLDEARIQLDTLHGMLERVNELVHVKASIGGLVSANDHLGAAEQIQYGRKLLSGQLDDVAMSLEHQSEDGERSHPTVRLDQLNSLQSCGQQFQQYQSLVVQNLSEEVTEAFLNWKVLAPGRSVAEDALRVSQMMEALRMCGALDSAGQIYVRRIQQTLRMTVRTTIAEFDDSSANGRNGKSGGGSGGGVTGMKYSSFSTCLSLLLEELLSILVMAKAVDDFCVAKEIFGTDESPSFTKRWTHEAVSTGAELASQAIAEILRLRKEAHSLISLDDMRQLWDACIEFVSQVEQTSGTKAVSLRSTLLGQAKAFLQRTHESNMSALVAALDSERWTQCEVSSERQDVLTRLCSGRAVFANTQRRRNADNQSTATDINAVSASSSAKRPTADVEGTSYKVVWSCLLLVEMVMTNLSAAAHFQSLAANAVGKVAELLRLFNTRATQLVLGAGAIHSAARLKSINAKHLSLVTQCLGMMLALFPHIRAALMAQLPTKQHALLKDLDTIRADYAEHNEKVLNKFVTIIGGIVEHSLASKIAGMNFDRRGRELAINGEEDVNCCQFFDGVTTNTRKMHQVLNNLLPPDHLQDAFSRIFAYVDQKVPALLISADSDAQGKLSANGAATPAPSFQFPQTEKGKRRLLVELDFMTRSLNGLEGVLAWDFSAVSVIERRINYRLKDDIQQPSSDSMQSNAGSVDAKQSDQADGTQVGGSGKADASTSKADDPAVNGEANMDEAANGAAKAACETNSESGDRKSDEPIANGVAKGQDGNRDKVTNTNDELNDKDS